MTMNNRNTGKIGLVYINKDKICQKGCKFYLEEKSWISHNLSEILSVKEGFIKVKYQSDNKIFLNV